ncbi:hypothetical protein ACFWY5_23880 [Nonomuraea sp. NPDC059007]|uniref:hypothetical protein n=1 Tax=Nonomuraea sp. NPDC059007 TaxID=3346692 RepID=UPI00367462F8
MALSVSRLDQGGGQVVAELTDATARTVDLLVGADGIRSAVRDLIGRPTPIRYHGQMVWRALVPRPGWATGIHTFAGPVHQAGVVPISAGQAYGFLTENGVRPDVLPEAGLAPRVGELLAPLTGRVAEIRPQVARSTERTTSRTPPRTSTSPLSTVTRRTPGSFPASTWEPAPSCHRRPARPTIHGKELTCPPPG